MKQEPEKVTRELNEHQKPDPAKSPLWEIVQSLNTKQVLSICGFVVATFAAGFGLSEWLGGIRHQQEIYRLENDLAAAKGQVVSAEAATAAVRDKLDEANGRVDEIAQRSAELIERADHKARAYRAKGEFLTRYLAYLESPEPGGAMFKIFADHVCELWKGTQRDVLDLETRRTINFSIQRSDFIPPEVANALKEVGITREMLNEYKRLERFVNTTRRSANPFVNKPPQLGRLRALESQIQNRLQQLPTTKSITFFDNSYFEIPQPIAERVHLRTDCKP